MTFVRRDELSRDYEVEEALLHPRPGRADGLPALDHRAEDVIRTQAAKVFARELGLYDVDPGDVRVKLGRLDAPKTRWVATATYTYFTFHDIEEAPDA